ncbi:MAG: type 4a pilus biogenesis protein PilO [Candidatus Zixiibacteriota bacterium]
MDLRESKSQKILLIVLVAFLAIYFWHARFYSNYSKKISGRQLEYETLLTHLKKVELKAQSVESLKAEYQNLWEKYRNVEELLPEENEVPLFLSQMHTAAQMSQARILELVPKEPLPVSFYNSLDYTVKLEGNYHDMGKFLCNVANFPFLNSVSEVSIQGLPLELAKGRRNKFPITSAFKLTTYFIREDEKLKKLEL